MLFRSCHERASGTCRDETNLTCQFRPAKRRGRQGTDFACVETGERKPKGCRRTAWNRTYNAVQQAGRIWVEIQIQAIIAGNSSDLAIFAKIINMNTSFWDSNLFQTIVLIVTIGTTVGIALWQFHAHKQTELRNAVSILILQIKDIEKI